MDQWTDCRFASLDAVTPFQTGGVLADETCEMDRRGRDRGDGLGAGVGFRNSRGADRDRIHGRACNWRRTHRTLCLERRTAFRSRSAEPGSAVPRAYSFACPASRARAGWTPDLFHSGVRAEVRCAAQTASNFWRDLAPRGGIASARATRAE